MFNDHPIVILGQWAPLLWEGFSQAIDWMSHDAPQHIIEILPGIELACLAGLDQAKE